MILEGNNDNLLQQELEKLLELERLARQNNELEQSLKIAKEIMALLLQEKDMELLKKTVTNLCNKRGQPIKTVTYIVKECMQFSNTLDNQETRIDFIKTLKDITEKKIYLEVEYARCCMILVKFNEDKTNNIEEAVKIMENVQVETYGSMSKEEKFEFILYQMKLNILLNDFTRLIIVARKINPTHLEEKGFEYLKLTYFLYKYHYHKQMKEYKDCTECLIKVFQAFTSDENQNFNDKLDKIVIQKFNLFLDKKRLTECILTFKCLEEFSEAKLTEVEDLKNKYEVYCLDQHSLMNLLQAFITKEISSCNLKNYPSQQFLIFKDDFEQHQILQNELQRQLIKKNLFFIARYYKFIHLDKIAVFLDNNVNLIEDLICEMIQDDLVLGKIDRLTRILEIMDNKTDDEVLDKWVNNINEIVDLVDFVTERIEREEITA